MKSLSDKLSLEKYQKKDKKLCKHYWQEEAKNICEEFGIKGKWSTMIFQKAKRNLPELKSKIEYCREKGIKNGRYLIAMYRKQPMKEETRELILKELRREYLEGNYYSMMKILKIKGWMLTPDKYNDIIEASKKIKPTKLLEDAQEIMGEK